MQAQIKQDSRLPLQAATEFFQSPILPQNDQQWNTRAPKKLRNLSEGAKILPDQEPDAENTKDDVVQELISHETL